MSDQSVTSSTSTLARVALAAVLLITVVFGWFAVRRQLGDLFAELTNPNDPNAAQIAILAESMAPDDPLVKWFRASIEANTFSDEKAQSAARLFEDTVRLSPNDYRWWIELGRAYEQADRLDNAESAFRRALELGPSYTYSHWQLGNFYLRHSRNDEAFAELKRATENNEIYRQQVFSLMWDYFDKDPSKIEQIAADQPDVYASLALFYAGRGQGADALRIWNRLTPEQKREYPQNHQVIAQGLYDKRYYPQALEFARQLGIDPDAAPGAVTNAGFEKPIGNSDDTRFGWKVMRNDGKLDISTDSGVHHEGGRSLKITFRTYAKPELYNIFQTVVVEPGKNYRLRFWLRTENLKSGGNPQIQIVNGNDDKIITVSAPFQSGTADWREISIDFATPTNCNGIVIRTVRSYCGDNCPIMGTMWYDDFSLSN